MRMIDEPRGEDRLSDYGELLRFAALIYEDEEEGDPRPFEPYNVDGDFVMVDDRPAADDAFDAWVEALREAEGQFLEEGEEEGFVALVRTPLGMAIIAGTSMMGFDGPDLSTILPGARVHRSVPHMSWDRIVEEIERPRAAKPAPSADPMADRNLAMFAREDADIDVHGFHYCLVFGGRDSPGFVYTSGLAEKGLPEFIFVGGSEPNVAGYLEAFVRHALAGHPVPIGLVPAGDGEGPNPFRVPAWVAEADERLSTHAFGVEARLRRIGSTAVPRLLQVIMPDLESRFPWDEGYRWRDQLVSKRPG